MGLDPSSRSRLTPRTAARFTGSSLFDKIARAVCAANALPRKELYEAWHVARRVHRRFRGGRIVDLCAGHGLAGQLLALLDPEATGAVCVDRSIPPSAAAISATLAAQFPALTGRVTYHAAPIESFPLTSADLVIAVHACGRLTDVVLERAAEARARVAVLPCCHDLDAAELGGLAGWVDGALACDVVRATQLRARGYRVFTHTIDPAITPKNRILLGEPLPG